MSMDTSYQALEGRQKLSEIASTGHDHYLEGIKTGINMAQSGLRHDFTVPDPFRAGDVPGQLRFRPGAATSAEISVFGSAHQE